MINHSKKKLLILCPRFPYPVIGGDRLRIFQICKELSNHFSLTLLSLCESNHELLMTPPDDGVFSKIERVLLTRNRSYFNVLMSLFFRTPLQIAYYRSKHYEKAVNRLLPDHDAVLVHLIRCADYVRHADKIRILEMTDAISLNYSRFNIIKDYKNLRSYIYRLESKRLLKYEKEIIHDFDLSILVSPVDRSYLLENNEKNSDRLIVSSNGVAFDKLPFLERSTSNPVIVFIGNMHSLQNMDACLYFAREILPMLRNEITVTFRVVGQIKDSDSRRLLSFPNVEVTGSVNCVAKAVEDARLGICPVRLAAGVQNKILEYMALGLPVLTSNIGLEGLSAIPNRDLIVANAPETWRDRIIEIWEDKKKRQSLAINGLAYVQNHHHWKNQLSPILDAISELLHSSVDEVESGSS